MAALNVITCECRNERSWSNATTTTKQQERIYRRRRNLSNFRKNNEAKLWLERSYNNNTASTKSGTQRTTGTKNMRTVLKCLFTIHIRVVTWRGLRGFSTSGLPVVGG